MSPFLDDLVLDSSDSRQLRGRYSAGARSADSKLHALWAPSQKGRVFDAPQRHRAITGLLESSG